MKYFHTPTSKTAWDIARTFVEQKMPFVALLEGIPGAGKTAWAKALAESQGWNFFRYDCNPESNLGLIASYDVDGIVTRTSAYVKGPIWEAFESPMPSVVLIDEIDKSPKDFEAYCLRVTDELSFRSPKGDTIEAKSPLVIVFTSNRRRILSDEFNRRCFKVEIPYPTDKTLRSIVKQETLVNTGDSGNQVAEILCQMAEKLLGKIDPNKMPSPKGIAMATMAICGNPTKEVTLQEIQIIMSGYLLREISHSDLNSIVKTNVAKNILQYVR